MNCWGFNMLQVESLSDGSPLRYVAFELFRIHELFKTFEVGGSQREGIHLDHVLFVF